MKVEWPLGSLGIYLHIPFCRKKCSYCDFYSLAGANQADLAAYTAALSAEIAATPSISDMPVDSIYFGGGTPSLLQPVQVDLLLGTLASRFGLSRDVEITIEVNPATVHKKDWPAYKSAGINRVSLGVQSLDDHELGVLGRVHSARMAKATIQDLEQVGFDNISLDLIYGIPGQTMSSWLRTLEGVKGFNLQHLSMYLLQLSASVPLAQSIAKGDLGLPPEELIEEMYYQGLDYLYQNSLIQYEISNLAQPGHACRHSLRYWRCGEYQGFGAGAVSYRSGQRWQNVADLRGYTSRQGSPQRVLLEDMTPRQQAAEAIILGLRLRQGISIASLLQRFDFDVMLHHREVVQRFISGGLLECEDGWLRLTKRGFLLSNQVLCHFVA